MLRLTNLSVPLDYTEDSLRLLLLQKMKLPSDQLLSFHVSRRSVDARNKGDVHFVLSSIDNPTPHVPNHLQKIKSMMKFLEFDLWSELECNALIDMIANHLTVPKVLDKTDMIAKCGNLPRPIKSIFREVHQIGYSKDLDPESVSKIIMRF